MRLIFSFVLLLFAVAASSQVLDTGSLRGTNSGYDEQNPVLSPDGTTLYFTITNHPSNIGGRKDPGDIWLSHLVGENWSAPVHAGPVINDRGYNAVAGISARGDQLFLHGHYDPQGGLARTQGISVSTNEGHGWSRPVNLVIPYFVNKSSLISGMVSEDGRVFVFSAETYGSLGVEDIFISFNNEGRWSEPKNLGASINTSLQEISPALSFDQKTLYFSTNGRKGYGSFDVYASTRLDDTWTSWSEPMNLGPGINTSGRDLYYRPNHFGYVLYTSTNNSDGYGDIKRYTPEKPVTIPDTIVSLPKPVHTVRIIEAPVETVTLKPNTIRIYGKVTNSKTGESVPATISFSGPGIPEQKTNATSDGFSINLGASADYTVTIEAKGYVSAMEKLDVHTYELKELEMNFTIQPALVGTTVNLKNVLFAQAKTEILPESYPELDLVVSFLQSNPNVRIELSGHTDNRGVHQDNVKLSQQRVNKVKQYLVSKGIDARRITGKGYGGLKPIASNDTEESRRMNRRVEFTIKRS